MSYLPVSRGSLLLPISIFFISFYSHAQDILWEKSYGGKHADYLFDAQPTADYGFILAGSSLSGKTGNKAQANHGDLDYWIWKMDEHGELDWQKSFGGSGPDKLRCIRLTNDGGYLLAGSSMSGIGPDKKEASRGSADFWIIKLNAKGEEEWQRTLGGAGQDELTSADVTMDGGFVIGGSSSSAVSGDKAKAAYGGKDFWIIKLDSKGNTEWEQTLGGKYDDALKCVLQTKDGGYIAGGTSNSPDSGNKTTRCSGKEDYWIIRLDDKGEIAWQQSFGGEKEDYLSVVQQTSDKGFIIGGYSNSDPSATKKKSSKSGLDFWLIKLDEAGGSIWQETYNIGKTDILNGIVENDDQTFLLAGYAQSEVSGKKTDKDEINDYVAIKTDSKGEELWRKSVGSLGEDVLKKAIETRDGGYLLAGTSDGKPSKDKKSGKGSNDFWVVKLKDEKKPEKPKPNVEAFPNPTSEYTNIIVGYEFEKGTAALYDLAGRQLQSFEITERTIPINLGSLPEGIYIVEIRAGKHKDSVKIIKGLKY